MNGIINWKADLYVMMVAFIYAVIGPILMLGERLGLEEGTPFDLDLMVQGVIAAVCTMAMYYVYEFLYSYGFYRLKSELLKFTLGMLLIGIYLKYVSVSPLVSLARNYILPEAYIFLDWTRVAFVMLVAMVIMIVASLIYDHTLGETLFRLGIMYVAAFGNGVIVLERYQDRLSEPSIFVITSMFLLVLSLRQLFRSKGLPVLSQHYYYE